MVHPDNAVVSQRVPAVAPLVAVTDEGLGNTSWVISLDGDAVVVDPARDRAPYEQAADELDAPIVLAAETHLHADFVTGSRELAARGASVAASSGGDLAWPHQGLGAGDELDFGRWRIKALATPGHTPEHVSYLLSEDGHNRAVFTGGSLLVGAVARTDLIDPDDTESLTRALWRSINHELLALGDDVAVYPTHGAGSFCTAAGGGRRWTTIGHERRSNPLLRAESEDEFVRQVLAGFGSYPPYFGRMRELNRVGPAVYGELPALRPLRAADVQDLGARGAVLVDTRSVAHYAAGHIPGSLANTLRPQFASWLGWLVEDPAVPLVFVTDAHTDRRELVRQSLNIGYENLAGEIDLETWTASGGATLTSPLVGSEQLHRHRILDVRQTGEFRAGHVPGASHVELGDLPNRSPGADERPLVAMCGHGERAATAVSVLEAAGQPGVAILDGGPGDWAETTGEQLARQP